MALWATTFVGVNGHRDREVRFRGQNGRLGIVVDAVRLAPRLWDGQRLLRFLAGLAMLALAFAAHAGLTGPAALSTPVAISTTTTTAVAPASDSAVDSAPVVAVDSAPFTAVDSAPVSGVGSAPVTAGDASVGTSGDDLGVSVLSGVVVVALVGVILAGSAPRAGVRPGELSGFGTRGPPLR